MTRLILGILLALLVPVQSWAAFAHVQSDCNTGNIFAGTSAYVYTYPSGITAGNLVVISVGTGGDRSVSSVAGAGTTYTINGADTSHAGGSHNSQWKAIASGVDVAVTVTLSGTTAEDSTVCFAEFSGAAADQSASTANGAAGSNTTVHNSGSVTPPTAANVVVASMERTSEDNWVFDAAFTTVTTGTDTYGFGYLIQAAATAQENNSTCDTNGFSAMRIGAFAGASAGGPDVTPFIRRRIP